MTKSELQAAYDDVCQVLDEIGSILENDEASAKEKLKEIGQLVFEEEEQDEEDA